ncbi:MAG: metallophosphoesterase [Candidatus Paceibacterota bacterium]
MKTKTIVQISDLHFGRVERKAIQPLIRNIEAINPELVIISGDLTQRAKEREYLEARKFIKSLNRPTFIIPGNHDIPLYNILERFHSPFRKYSKFISPDISPFYRDNDIAIVAINSVRNFTVSSGKISKEQLEEAEKILQNVDSKLIKIVVCHHPFDIPINKKTTHKVVAHSKIAMERLSKYNIDVFLSGHIHISHIGDTASRYKIDGYNGIIVQAGTAISKRYRGEPVSFNVLKIRHKEIVVDNYAGNESLSNFDIASTKKFVEKNNVWKMLDK